MTTAPSSANYTSAASMWFVAIEATPTKGMQDLKTILDAAGVHTADNWVTLDALVGVSADGKVMTGYGLNPRSKAFPFGVWTPFRVVLPAP